MKRKTPTRLFRLNEASRSALTRSTAGLLIRRLGTNSETISRIMGIVQQAVDQSCEADRPDESGYGPLGRMFNNADPERHPGSLERQIHLEALRRLALAAEFSDYDSGTHIARVSCYSALLAEKLGLPQEEIQRIYNGAFLHDVGKIGIPDGILTKPGKLSPEEFEILKAHTEIGARILADAHSRLLNVAKQIALHHHERWDGSGYPQGLAANEIPVSARIVGLADTFDAMTTDRPYRKARSVEEACEIIEKAREKQLDPVIVSAFLSNIDELLKIRDKMEPP